MFTVRCPENTEKCLVSSKNYESVDGKFIMKNNKI